MPSSVCNLSEKRQKRDETHKIFIFGIAVCGFVNFMVSEVALAQPIDVGTPIFHVPISYDVNGDVVQGAKYE